MKFTVWGRELQWRTSGRESISFPTVSIERSKEGEENKRETCSKHDDGNSNALSPFSASSNSLLHLFRKRSHQQQLSKKSTRPKVGILTHDSAIRWIGCAVLLLNARESQRVEESKGSSITVDKRWWWWMWSFTLRGCLRSE
jgi:hypothetical protein